MTRVLVNLTWLVPGVVGGSEEASTGALRALADHPDPRFELVLAVLEPFGAAHPDLLDRYESVVLDQSGSNRVRRVWADQTWLAAQAQRCRAEVVHHAGGTVPFRHPGRVVLTVHDTQPLDSPGNFSLLKRTYLRVMSQRSFRAADVIVTPSRFTAERVRMHGAPPTTPVRIVPWTVPPPSAVDVRVNERLAAELEDHRYLLYPAIPYVHKGHSVLLEAFARVVADHHDVRLVLTGRPGPLDAEIAERIARPDLAGRVLRTPRLPRSELNWLRRDATLVVVPSAYEGFGLPVLEAMRDGVRVLVSAAGSLPEVANPGDVVDPGSAPDWSRAIAEVLCESPEERRTCVLAGRRRAEEFTPTVTAAGLYDAYRESVS